MQVLFVVTINLDLGSMSECHKLLMHANTLKGLLLRAEGRKDESFKVYHILPNLLSCNQLYRIVNNV